MTERGGRRQRGMTLIEVTVALAVAVVLFASVVIGVGALTGARAKEAAGELAGAIRSLYDTAALQGRTCRLVFELPEEREEDTAVSWHAECAKGAVTTSSKRDEELRAATTREQDKRKGRAPKGEEDDRRFKLMADSSAPSVQELQAREEKRVADLSKFSSFEGEEIIPHKLSGNVQLEVWTKKQREPVKHGVAYLYFFPQGFTERAQVYLRQGSNVWTITVAPLTGKTAVVSEELEVPRS